MKKANQMLAMIQGTITYKNKKMLLLMYKSLVRPHLEYVLQAWSPHQLGHIILIEGVQRRVTRMIPELKSLPYEARLKRLNLTLERRRIRGDLIEVPSFPVYNPHLCIIRTPLLQHKSVEKSIYVSVYNPHPDFMHGQTQMLLHTN